MTDTKKDEPLVPWAATPVGELEMKAMAMYRAKHPDGPLWQELAVETRTMWMNHAEKHHD